MSVPHLHQRRPDWRNSKCGREESESALIGRDWQRLPSPFLPGMASGRRMKQVPQGQVPRIQTSGAKTQPSLIWAHTFLCVLWHRSREGELLCVCLVLPGGLCKPVTNAKNCPCLGLLLSHWPTLFHFCWEACLPSLRAVISASTSWELSDSTSQDDGRQVGVLCEW